MLSKPIQTEYVNHEHTLSICVCVSDASGKKLNHNDGKPPTKRLDEM